MTEGESTEVPGDRRFDAVFDYLRDSVNSIVAYDSHLEILNEAVDSLQHIIATEGSHRLAAAELPVIISEGLGQPTLGIAIAAATTAAYIGIDVVDDLLDSDMPIYWPTRKASEVALGGAMAYCTLAQSILLRVDVDAGRRVHALDELAQSLVALAAAEQTDVAAFGTHQSAAAALDVVGGKSGRMLAGFARITAIMCGVSSATNLAEFGAFGSQLATARQLASDILELRPGDESSDHRNMASTLPIALAAASLDEDALRSLQADAAHSRDGREALWAELIGCGAIGQALVYAELASAEAATRARSLGLSADAEGQLVALCRRASIAELLGDALTT